ncbi:MAG: DUF1641 domain-containing protein [Halodesulfurarchaeum sp.]
MNDVSDIEAETSSIENAMDKLLELEQSGTLDDLAEAANVISLAKEAMEDEMVVSMMHMASRLAEAGDGLATDETVRMADTMGANAGDLETALEKMIVLEQDGTLDDLTEAANTISLASEALDDDMVSSVVGAAGQAGELLDSAAGEPQALRNLEVLMAALGDAAADPSESPEQVGMIGALRKMGDPDVQRGMGFMLRLAGALGENLEARSEAYDQAEN